MDFDFLISRPPRIGKKQNVIAAEMSPLTSTRSPDALSVLAQASPLLSLPVQDQSWMLNVFDETFSSSYVMSSLKRRGRGVYFFYSDNGICRHRSWCTSSQQSGGVRSANVNDRGDSSQEFIPSIDQPRYHETMFFILPPPTKVRSDVAVQ